MKLSLIIASIVLFAGGCAAPMTQEQLAELAGPKPTPETCNTVVTGWMNKNLLDPYSAHMTIGDIYADRWYVGYQWEPVYGWVVPADINAKNAYGGYVGSKGYLFLVKDDKLHDIEYVQTAIR